MSAHKSQKQTLPSKVLPSSRRRTGSIPPATAPSSVQPDNRVRVPLVLGALLVSILLASLGIFQLRSNGLTTGAVALLIALILFAAASAQLGHLDLTPMELRPLTGRWLPVGLVILAIFLCVLASYEVGLPRSIAANEAAAAFWIMSLACVVAGTLWMNGWRRSARGVIASIQSNRFDLMVIAALFVLALLPRIYDLAQYPIPWSGDEASVDIGGRQMLSLGSIDLFDTGWGGQPNASFYLNAFGQLVWGHTVLAGRLVSAIVGALTIITLYGLGREFFGRGVAFLSAAFLITFPYHLQFSRLGITTVFDCFNVTLALWLAVRAVRKGSLPAFMLAGLVAGLSPYTFVGSRLVPVLSLLSLACALASERQLLRARLPHLGIYAASVLVSFGPMAYFFAKHPDVFMDRTGQVGIIFNNWLGQEAVRRGTSVAAVLLSQFTRTTAVYVAQGVRSAFFSSPQPYLTIVGSVLFLVGMTYAFQQIKSPPYGILLFWFWSVVFIGGVLTVDPPAQTRLFMTAPAIALLVAIGIQRLVEVASAMRLPRAWQLGATAAAIVFLVAQNAIFYFGSLRASHFAQDPNAEVAMQAGLELQRLGPDYSLVMISQPRMVSGFPTIPFLAPQNPRIDLTSDQATQFDLSGRLPALVLATPDNLGGLQTIAQRYPGGTWETVPSSMRDETLYYAYTLGLTSRSGTP